MYILSGPDDFSRAQALEKIKNSIGDRETLATNTAALEGQQLTVGQLRPVCEAAPFLAEKRLVIVTGLLQRFEPRRRPARQARGRRTTVPSDDCKPLGEYILAVPDSTVVVLVDDEVKSGNPLFKMLSGKAEVQSFPLLRDARLRQWVQEHVKEEGGSVSPRAVDVLARLVGSNLWAMSGEVEKLLLYAAGRCVEEEDIRLLVGYTQQSSVFAMVDAIVEFRVQAAEKLLQQLLQQGAAPSYLLAMLSRQMRLIVRAKEAKTVRTSVNELRGRLGLSSEFQVRRVMEQAERYSMPRIKYVYRKLLETDVAIKTGRYDPELALGILVAEVCQRQAV